MTNLGRNWLTAINHVKTVRVCQWWVFTVKKHIIEIRVKATRNISSICTRDRWLWKRGNVVTEKNHVDLIFQIINFLCYAFGLWLFQPTALSKRTNERARHSQIDQNVAQHVVFHSPHRFFLSTFVRSCSLRSPFLIKSLIHTPPIWCCQIHSP